MKKFILSICALALILPAMAMAQIKVAAGSKGGTYMTEMTELNRYCPGLMTVTETKGSLQNLDLLAANQVNAGIVQMDALFLKSKTKDLSRLKTLFTLHPEEVHVVVRNADLKSGGFLGFGEKSTAVRTVADLKGRMVGAASGSIVTTQLIDSLGGLGLQIQQFDTNDQALKALAANQIDGLIAVGGQPYAFISGLTNQYKLASLPPDLTAKLIASGAYIKADVSYDNLGQASFPTVATPAMFVTRDYTLPEVVKQLTDLRACMYNKLPLIAQTTGTHPKWQTVSPDFKGKWPLFSPQ